MEPSLLEAKPQPGDRIGEWTLATDDTRLVIGATKDGQLVVYELSSPKAGWNWTRIPSVFRLMRTAAVAGATRDLKWSFLDAVVDRADGHKVSLRFACERPGLELTSAWHARPGRGPVRHAMFIANRSGQTLTIGWQPSVDLDMRHSAQYGALQACYVHDMGGSWWDMALHCGVSHEIVSGKCVREMAATPGYDWVPIVYLEPVEGHGVYAAIEWSNSYFTVAGQPARESSVRIDAGNRRDFTAEIPAGDVFEVPPALIGAYKGDIDDAANGLRKYLFNYSMPEELKTDSTYPKLQWNAFTATGKEHRKGQSDPTAWDPVESKFYPLIAEAAALGWEEMTVDVGWWKENEPDTDDTDWPRGMKAAGEATHKLGMHYGLYWTDKESMTTPEGRAKRAQRIKRLFDEYGADTWRSDSTRGAVVKADYWDVKGFYTMLDALKKEVPGFQWENCSGGGPIKDYGAMKRATKIQICDSVNPAINTRRVFYDTSHALHPVQMQSMLGWHNRTAPGAPGALVYDFRSCAMGAFMWWFDSPSPTNGGTVWTDEERKAIAREAAMYKTRLRPLIRNADLYHILPRPDDKNWDGIQYYDPAAKKGVVYLFKPAAGADIMTIRLRGVEPKTTYRVTFEDGTNPSVEKTGEDLAKGIQVVLKGAPVSELVFLEAK